ncbi:MAG: sigma-70 family RNA polymerase sigma factor [Deltaproteobacteria bacterium]|nr:sigma-70 family RNA polymerase sigma factor [Deltaproteobacteria bacterium]
MLRLSPALPAEPKAGESDALGAEDVRRIEGWVRRLAGPGCDAEDLVQEVLIAAWKGRSAFRGDAKLGTWLFRITEKVILKRRRSEGRFRRWLKRSEHEPDHVAHIRGPGEDLERQEKVRLLYKALDRLPEKHRTPLILFELEGMETEAIGLLLGCTPNNVRVRLHRGRAQLFVELSQLQSGSKGASHE